MSNSDARAKAFIIGLVRGPWRLPAAISRRKGGTPTEEDSEGRELGNAQSGCLRYRETLEARPDVAHYRVREDFEEETHRGTTPDDAPLIHRSPSNLRGAQPVF